MFFFDDFLWDAAWFNELVDFVEDDPATESPHPTIDDTDARSSLPPIPDSASNDAPLKQEYPPAD